MRYEQLPQKMRDQVDAQLGRKQRTKSTRREVPLSESPGLPLRCVRCDVEIFPATDGALSKHTAQTGHGRFEHRPSD